MNKFKNAARAILNTLNFKPDRRKQPSQNRAGDNLRQLNRLYAFLSQVNQTIVHAPDKETLFSEICKVAISHGKFRMAWIGLIDEQDNTVTPVAWHGNKDGYLSTIPKLTANDVPEGRGPTGKAIRSKSVSYINDLANDPVAAPWRDEAIKRGYRSSCSMPLVLNGNVVGVFNIYAPEPFFFVDDEFKLLQEIANDISFALDKFEKEKQRNNATAAVLAGEERFRALYDNNPLMIFTLNPDGTILSVNETGIEQLGYSREELVGHSVLKLFHEDDIPKVIGQKEKCLLCPDEINSWELRKITKQGKLMWVQETARVLTDHSGKKYILVICDDISERKLADEAVKETEERFKISFEKARDGILVFTKEQRLLSANEEMIRLTDYSKEELFSLKLPDIFVEASLPESRERIMLLLKGETIPPFEAHLLTRAGNSIPVEINVSCMKNVYGFDIVFQGGIRDITERKQAEEQITEQLDELKRWQVVMIGRESRNIELKHEVNELLKQTGKPEKYKS
ncbi:MAG: PAS domain S-box protein [Bacteroidota bacterium]|nr:PAS domain S-box protein [Bacteroidota bacterium]